MSAVRMGPGQMQLTVMPSGPRSTARACVRPMTAVLATTYGLSPGVAPRPSVDAMLTMRAASDFLKYGSANEKLLSGQESVQRTVPNLVVAVLVDSAKGTEAGVVDQDIETSETPRNLFNHALDLRAIEDVESPCRRFTTGRTDLIDHRRYARTIDVGDRYLGAFLRKQVSRRAAHPTGGTGNQHRPPCH